MEVDILKENFSLKDFFTRKIPKTIERSTKKWSITAGPELKRNIKANLEVGLSPVKGHGRFVGYSESYRKKIMDGEYDHFNKKLRPVNLKLSGEMYKSLSVRSVKNGVQVSFKDPKAVYHDRLGAGKSKVIRRLLPGKGEQFSKTVIDPVMKKLDNEIKTNLKKIFNE